MASGPRWRSRQTPWWSLLGTEAAYRHRPAFSKRKAALSTPPGSSARGLVGVRGNPLPHSRAHANDTLEQAPSWWIRLLKSRSGRDLQPGSNTRSRRGTRRSHTAPSCIDSGLCHQWLSPAPGSPAPAVSQGNLGIEGKLLAAGVLEVSPPVTLLVAHEARISLACCDITL